MWSESFQAVQRGSAVLLVLGLLWLMLWLLRKKGVAQFSMRPFGGGQRRLNVVERLPLTAQHSLFLVETNGQTLLLGASPAGINLIETTARKNPSPALAWPESQAQQ